MTKQYNGKVVPFKRTAAEVRGLATRQQERGHPLTALELLRLSLDKSPGDGETILSVAETYASIGCFAMSNAAYFSLAHQEAYAADCFYGMGANFFAMRAYGAAHDCLVLALQKDAQAPFAEDAVEMLDAIDSASHPLDFLEEKLQKRMERVLDAMDSGRPGLAARQIRRALALDGKSAGIRSLQAFSLLADLDAEGALDAARKAYKADKKDVRAICAMASALKALGSMEAARAYLLRAEAVVEQEDDAQLVCQTACEMGEHAFVANMLLKVEGRATYADELLHPLAVALYNTGEREEAMRRWRLLRRIDPMDAVAEYRLRLAEAEELQAPVPYTRQLPLSEILSRLDTLRRWVHEGPEALKTRWVADGALEALLRWGLASGEAGIPEAMCGVLTTVGDERAQRILRGILCDETMSETLKQSVLAALYTIGAEGPFYALVDDRLTLVHVTRAQKDAPPPEDAMDEMLRHVHRWLKPHTQAAEREIRALCERALQLGSKIPMKIRARAVALAYCERTGRAVPFSDTHCARRKAQRLAGRILKEESDALHEF